MRILQSRITAQRLSAAGNAPYASLVHAGDNGGFYLRDQGVLLCYDVAAR